MDHYRRRLPPLSALRAFEAAARHQSFRLAAAELSVTSTAVSHQIRQLEALLGVTLFERQVRKVVLTAEGQALFPVLRDSFDAMTAAVAPLLQPKRRRMLTVSATPAFVARLLIPRIADFQTRHPELDLRLHASTQPIDFATQQIDAAIRYGKGVYRDLHSEHLLHTRFAPLCSPRLALRTPEELVQHPLLHFQWQPTLPDPPDWTAWQRKAGSTTSQAARGITFSDETHAIDAAIAGQGVALLNTALVRDEFERGTLVAPFGPELDGFDYYLVHPPAVANDPAIGALRAWLQEIVPPSEAGMNS
ncbi:transcriptional regulator GcvA [Dyella subtropica]|uniref:transcriptional regulator GcvA n=1 Tax=Dyella subtropica TaxID=2992127 RepID=UPI00224CA36B|nr:transcriptional regulator GcvA [Dyella subtropica]